MPYQLYCPVKKANSTLACTRTRQGIGPLDLARVRLHFKYWIQFWASHYKDIGVLRVCPEVGDEAGKGSAEHAL